MLRIHPFSSCHDVTPRPNCRNCDNCNSTPYARIFVKFHRLLDCILSINFNSCVHTLHFHFSLKCRTAPKYKKGIIGLIQLRVHIFGLKWMYRQNVLWALYRLFVFSRKCVCHFKTTWLRPPAGYLRIRTEPISYYCLLLIYIVFAFILRWGGWDIW